MIKIINVCLFFLWTFMSPTIFAIETIEITGGVSKQINIAVMPYKEINPNQSVERMHQIISTDLYRSGFLDRKSTRLNSSHVKRSRMPSSA